MMYLKLKNANNKPKFKHKILKTTAIVLLSIAFIHVIHALTLDRIIQYTEVSLYSPNVPVETDGYRIALITDTHNISVKRMLSVVSQLNQNDIDLVTIGGDFSQDIDKLRRTVEIISQIEASDGIYGVEGNHDNYDILFPAMEENGITPLSNSGLYVRDNFFIAGIQDLWIRNADISKAIDGSQPEDFVLLISHNPGITTLQSTVGIDLVLSGHTHGGQITFFGIWAPIFTFNRYASKYGQSFSRGWAKSPDDVPIYVSRGVGENVPRVFSRPQVVIITLHRE